MVVGLDRTAFGVGEVWVLRRWQTMGTAHPRPPGPWARQRGGDRCRSGRGVEWQGRRKSPQGKHLRQLTGAVTQALGAGTKSIDEGSVLGAEFEFSLLV